MAVPAAVISSVLLLICLFPAALVTAVRDRLPSRLDPLHCSSGPLIYILSKAATVSFTLASSAE